MRMTQSTALMTDMYELTMIDAALQSGTASRRSVFELFGRRLPGNRRYGVVAGTGRVLDAIEKFRFGDEELTYLRDNHVVSERALEWLADYKFTGDLYGYAEGELYFPGSPVITAVGSFAECCVLETVALSIMNYDSAVATAASRMTIAAHGRPCADFGARRAHESAAVAAARAAYIAGFSSTSDLEAGRRYGIPVSGTSAHSFTLVHDSEPDAFAAQIENMGVGTTLLVDTYSIPSGVENAVKAARDAGGELGAVRIDSGDLIAGAFKVREQLDKLGATKTKITVTSDLDEYALAGLQAAPVDGYGIGTRLVTGSGYPTAQLVYKIVEREGSDGKMHEVGKRSENKASVGGLKVAGRLSEDGHASEELIVSAQTFEEGLEYIRSRGARPVQVKLISEGKIDDRYRARNVLPEARDRHISSRRDLPYDGWRLSGGDPAIPTTYVDIFSDDDAPSQATEKGNPFASR
ncbi:nicotinate phosphoribosyltransferase [Actinobaculum massiliense]|nr:nicotinate phosphoribosyltransferase [Actinobaculum massiliense]MDK8319601.1 nicotinate phosphoribosyltransferase [Actinobaculum massiliense]MDK8567911.1 nicotinate phosphoribosyltransferase [Actinobaculum massiliense]